MLILLLLFSSIAFAEDLSSEKYCFSSVQQSFSARQKFAMIQVPGDVVHTDDRCLVIQMRPHRRELVQRYIIQSFPNVSIAFSSDDIRRPTCKLKVEKEKNKNTDNLNIDFDKKNADVIRVETKAIEKDEMVIETMSDFDLSVDQDQIKGSCRFITADRYEITLEVSKNPRPHVPANLPPGSIVILNQTPPDQETSKLKTTLQLNRGDRLLVGDVLKTLRGDGHKIDIRPEVSVESDAQNGSEKVFLSLQ